MGELTAGEKSDVTKIINRLRLKYGGAPKAATRRESVASLRAAGARRPIVLWGGGRDAELCRGYGMEPIVVDDGSEIPRIAKDRKGKVARYRRAFISWCEANGFEWRWDPVERVAHEADSAILDFCSHWSDEISRAAHACRHMLAISVTLMPSRFEIGNATRHQWKVVYGSLLLDATGMFLASRPRIYLRSPGHSAMVLLLRKEFFVRPEASAQKMLVNARAASLRASTDGERRRAYQKEYGSRPEVLERNRERARQRYQANPEPYRARVNHRYATNPAYREYCRAYQKAYRLRKARLAPLAHAGS